jgi:teichuronic acid biosynthesis glycosyltransferase TuaH
MIQPFSQETDMRKPDDNTADHQHIVWIAGQSWDRDGGTHLEMATALAKHGHILYVDPPASPLTRDSARRIVKPVLVEATDRITRLRPVALPGFSRPGVRATTSLLLRAQLRWAIRKLGIHPSAVVMLYLGKFLGGWGKDVTNVLFGTDDYVAGAQLMRISPEYVRRREREALAKANVVVTVSADLAQRWSGMGADPVVIPNGCWPLGRADRTPYEKIDLPRPIVGLIGRLSERIDFDVIEAIADSGLSLLLMGPRDPRWEPNRFEKLTSKPTVRYIGPVPKTEVAAKLAAIDVGITPYRNNEFNRASFPLKTLEYLSAGIPVVATSLPATQWLKADLEETLPEHLSNQVLVLADNGQDYISAIRTLAAGRREAANHCIAFAERHSWSRRAERFAAEIGLQSAEDKVRDPPGDPDDG